MGYDFLQMFSEAEASSPDEGNVSAEEGEEDGSEEEFETLIKGKYAEAFRRRTQGIIDKRFSKMKGFERTAKAVTPLLEELTARFPEIDKSDTEGLIGAFLEDRKNNATKESETALPEEEETAPEILAAAENAVRSKLSADIISYLDSESVKLREIYPSFDLQGELQKHPEMGTLLNAGVSLRRAFETVNLESILGTALRFAVMKAKNDAALSIKQNMRVSENSVADRAASVMRTDVKNLTEKEIHKILSQVSKGAKITF